MKFCDDERHDWLCTLARLSAFLSGCAYVGGSILWLVRRVSGV